MAVTRPQRVRAGRNTFRSVGVLVAVGAGVAVGANVAVGVGAGSNALISATYSWSVPDSDQL